MQYRGTVNEVELIDWIGQDPEMRYTPQGTAVTTISVATKWPNHANGEIKTDWIAVEAWEKLAEQVTSSWEDRESGQRRSKMLVRADNVLFLDGRASSETENLLEEEQLEEILL